MNDMLEFPNITALDTAGQIQQIRSYLIQLKEQLEFILTNIGSDNLSVALRQQLNKLGADIRTTQTETSNSVQRVESAVSKQVLTVSDVINSTQYQASIQGVKDAVAIGENGSLKLIDGTVICYGTGAAEVTFGAEYSDVPTVITSPNIAATITTTGFTTDSTEAYSWLAIGRYEKQEEEEGEGEGGEE